MVTRPVELRVERYRSWRHRFRVRYRYRCSCGAGIGGYHVERWAWDGADHHAHRHTLL